MSFLSCFDQLLVVLNFLTAGDTMNFPSRLVYILIRGCWSVACADCREGCVEMMHVLDNVLVGHSGEEFDLGEVRIQTLDHTGR